MVSDEDEKKFILFIEMKAGKADNQEVIQQLKGSQCFIAYCREIGKSFWEEENFLQGYDYRFICFYNINLNKHSKGKKRSLNDYPEKMLKISGKEGHFKNLVYVVA